jgi:hypothetical protein
MFELIGTICTVYVSMKILLWLYRDSRDWYMNRWLQAVGFRARDALGLAMEDAGMPTCVRPASKRGRIVSVAIEGVCSREYPVDTSSAETIARDVSTAVEIERLGLRGG